MRLVAALLLVSAPAFAYSEAVHSAITHKAFPEAGEVLAPPSQADLDAFRELFWNRAARNPEFLRKYPASRSFSAWEFKEFLMLDPAARVHGFDIGPEAPMTHGDLLAAASRWPDDDERNRRRYLRDPRTHTVLEASDGSPMPYDPATLDFGSLSGTTSQGHAHYGLVDEPLSDDPAVLKKEPWRFAVPPTAHAYGLEFIDIYSELARLAGQSGLRSAPWLQAAFAGAAFHHIEDLCNQIHTVQVGIYEFFQSAFLQSKLRDLKTLGGVFGRRYSLKEVGLRLIANHHLLSEDLFAKHLRLPEGEERLTPRQIIAVSSREAPEVYRLAWRFSAKTLRDGIDGHEFDGAKGDDPDAYIDPSQTAAIEQFYALEERGIRRAVGALHAWQVGPERDLVPMLIAYHARAAERRADYRPAGPENLGIAWGYPVAAAVLLAGGVALIRWRSSPRQRA